MNIRPALAQDVVAITGIYSHHVINGLGTFEEEPPLATQMVERIGAVQDRGLPFLVAQSGDHVLGYAYAGPFRLREAYRFTVEDSVYVAPLAVGQGVGRALLTQVIAA